MAQYIMFYLTNAANSHIHDDIFKCIFLKGNSWNFNIWNFIKISLSLFLSKQTWVKF